MYSCGTFFFFVLLLCGCHFILQSVVFTKRRVHFFFRGGVSRRGPFYVEENQPLCASMLVEVEEEESFVARRLSFCCFFVHQKHYYKVNFGLF